jgi:hypothetical protein
LAGLAKLVNGVSGNGTYDMSGKTIRLDKDIMLNDTAGWRNWGSNGPSNRWTSIGKGSYTSQHTYSFRGTFNGNGHVINGIYVATSSGTFFQGCLFGYARGSGSKIQNIGVNASYINVSYVSAHLGGLVGYNEGGISNSYFIGTVEGNGPDIGGLVGQNEGSISNSYSIGTVTGTGSTDVGGLVGYQKGGSISNSYFTGDVNGTGSGKYVGGLVGTTGPNDGTTITNSYFTGSVMASGSGEKNVGGLVGFFQNTNSTITNSFSTGDVTSTATNATTNNIGGLVGNLDRDAKIEYSYSITNLFVGANVINAGGLVGIIQYFTSPSPSTIKESYSASKLNSSTTSCGGLIGKHEGTGSITKSYYDTDEFNSSCNSEHGTGATTEDMKKQSTFSDWIFNSYYWGIGSLNNGYPYLRSNPPPAGD